MKLMTEVPVLTDMPLNAFLRGTALLTTSKDVPPNPLVAEALKMLASLLYADGLDTARLSPWRHDLAAILLYERLGIKRVCQQAAAESEAADSLATDSVNTYTTEPAAAADAAAADAATADAGAPPAQQPAAPTAQPADGGDQPANGGDQPANGGTFQFENLNDDDENCLGKSSETGFPTIRPSPTGSSNGGKSRRIKPTLRPPKLPPKLLQQLPNRRQPQRRQHLKQKRQVHPVPTPTSQRRRHNQRTHSHRKQITKRQMSKASPRRRTFRQLRRWHRWTPESRRLKMHSWKKSRLTTMTDPLPRQLLLRRTRQLMMRRERQLMLRRERQLVLRREPIQVALGKSRFWLSATKS